MHKWKKVSNYHSQLTGKALMFVQDDLALLRKYQKRNKAQLH
ncbi:MAG: hypothetical protein JWR72_3880 [Flavisolibacter sp.]|nr:hypothetical protein [Flavisolibacter sp.]